MAIYHLSAQVISKSSGRSVVNAAAYRHAARMMNVQSGEIFNYSNKKNVHFSEISLPDETPQWFRDGLDGRDANGVSQFLWNAVELKEGAKGTGLAMEMNIALPVEFSAFQNAVLARDFIESEICSKGFVADWSFHNEKGNPHIHVMIPMRLLTDDGFGPKHDFLRDENGEILKRADGKPRYERMSPPQKYLGEWRRTWSEVANRHLALHGFNNRIDHRSFKEQGILLEPSSHLGVDAVHMDRKGTESRFVKEEREKKARNAERIKENPEEILKILSYEKSVFGYKDIDRVLRRYLDDKSEINRLKLHLGLSPDLVAVSAEVYDPESDRVVQDARFTTWELLNSELSMQKNAGQLWIQDHHGVRGVSVGKAFERFSFLNAEQRAAVAHVTGQSGLSCVIGFAGAGKSTMLGAANVAWMNDGVRVYGAALSGKAAEGLENSSGILSRTLASWELSWKNGNHLLQKGDVFVIDEAGMVSSHQMARFVSEVEKQGAKLVLVGDAMQLQPIEAGAAFRAITDIAGYVELSEIRRQNEEWMRQASISFARGDVKSALEAYNDHGALVYRDSIEEAKESLIEGWKQDFVKSFDQNNVHTLMLAHRNVDVFDLNNMARDVLKGEGLLENGQEFMTARGKREFSVNDRIVFLENNRDVDVKNGMLGIVTHFEDGRLSVLIPSEKGEGRTVSFSSEEYPNIDHGYATTIHKAQGATVDHVHVLASSMMDNHLGYVAMSRHRENVSLYVPTDQFNRHMVRGLSYEEQIHAVLEDLSVSMSRGGIKEVSLDYRDSEDFKEAAFTLTDTRDISALQAIADRLEVLEIQQRILPEQISSQSIRDQADYYAERRGYDSYSGILPGYLVSLQKWVKDQIQTTQILANLWERVEHVRNFVLDVSGIQQQAVVPSQTIEPVVVKPVIPDRDYDEQSVEELTSNIPVRNFENRIDHGVLIPAGSVDWEMFESTLHDKVCRDKPVQERLAMVRYLAERSFNNLDPFRTDVSQALSLPPEEYKKEVERIVSNIDAYGGLKGKEGFFASKDQKRIRDYAHENHKFIKKFLMDTYQVMSDEKERLRGLEAVRENRLSIAIPNLSPEARDALYKVCDKTKTEHDRVMAMREAMSTPGISQELDQFMKAVQDRFYQDYDFRTGYQPNIQEGYTLSDEVKKDLQAARSLSYDIKNEKEMSYEMRQEMEQKRALQRELSREMGIIR